MVSRSVTAMVSTPVWTLWQWSSTTMWRTWNRQTNLIFEVVKAIIGIRMSLFVGNISKRADMRSFERAFAQFGKVKIEKRVSDRRLTAAKFRICGVQ